jgi:hypothetical protein
MENQNNPLYGRLRLSGWFIILGLVVQALSLLWNHPLSFIAFVAAGGTLLAIGIILYLLTLVNLTADKPNGTSLKPVKTED